MSEQEKQETVAKIMELINGGQDFYELAVELAFSQKVNKEVYDIIIEDNSFKYDEVILMFMRKDVEIINKEIFINQLRKVVKGIPLKSYMAKNTRVDGRSILVKKVECEKCLPF